MRVRKRYAVMLAIAAAMGGVIIFQAVTAKPPEPYVELIGSGLPPAPVAWTECRDGEAWIHYRTGRNVELEPVPTGDRCDARGWDENGAVNRPDRQSQERHP